MCFDGEPDFKNRDPGNINGYLKVHFSDVIGEPDGTHSADCIWQGSECCYTFLSTVWYGLWVGLFHLCISPCWGIVFGCEAYAHVWIIEPFIRCFTLVISVPAKCLSCAVHCLLDPWCEASSFMFMMFATDSGGEQGRGGGRGVGPALDRLEKGGTRDSGGWGSYNMY